jgi:hypothetical protein
MEKYHRCSTRMPDTPGLRAEQRPFSNALACCLNSPHMDFAPNMQPEVQVAQKDT